MLLQSAARAKLARNEIGQQQAALQAFGPQWTSIQASWRGKKARQQLQSTQQMLQKHAVEISKLQGHAR
ncbi:hypothetical protein Micbo1qcDRAFT_162905, partial [Microdochium bolleyi]